MTERNVGSAPQTNNNDPITEPIPVYRDRKKVPINKKFIAAIALTGSLLGAGAAIAAGSGGEQSPSSSPKPVATGEANPTVEPSPEFVAAQHRVDEALPYLSKDNDENRAAFVEDLDKVSALKGANYFEGRGTEFVATADMKPDDALAWVELQMYKADQAAINGDTVAADAIASAVAEGQEYTEMVNAFQSDVPNVNASFVKTDAPIFEVVNNGTITANGTVYSINQPGTKMYAFTSVDTNTYSPMQEVLRFTPGTNGEEGAWAVVTTEKSNTITGVDIAQY